MIPFEITLANGQVVHGNYVLQNGMVHVAHGGRKKATQTGGMDPTSLAQMLLRELLAEARVLRTDP